MSSFAAVLVMLSAVAAEPKFTEAPKAVVDGGGVRITFAAAAPTDVEVSIVGADGSVVRHLAAGVLGRSVPSPLEPDSLRQSLRWDRTDDAGRTVAGPCSVRVGLGLAGRLERHVGFEPGSFRTIVGLAVNAAGELFVLDSEFTYGGCGLRVFSREGKYLRTLMPYSSGLPAERLASIGQLTLRDGTRLPIVYNAHGQNTLPYTSGMKHQTMAFDPAGRLVMFSAVGTIVEHGPPRHVLFLAADGGAPAGRDFIGPLIRKPRGFMGGSGEGSTRWYDHLAISDDGQWVYLSGGRFASPKHMRHAVARIRPTDPGLPEPWIGEPDKPGDDEAHLNDPQGLAVDRDGRLYIADRGNGRVVVHGPDGKRLGQFAVSDPIQVFVAPDGGPIYVTTGATDQYGRVLRFTLRKFAALQAGGEAPAELAHLDGEGMPVAALDAAAKPPRLWLAVTGRAGQDLLPVLDRGNALEAGEGLLKPAGVRQPMFVAADTPHGKLYVTEFRNQQLQFDLNSGARRVFAKGGEAAVDREGNVYVIEGYPPRVFLYRYDAEGKPSNFAGTSSNKIGPIDTASKGPNVGFRGHRIAPNGDIYIVEMKFYGRGRVVVYRPDGTLKHEALVRDLINGSGGIAVDRAGNVFLSGNLKPADQIYPPDFAAELPAAGWVWWRKPRPAPWDRTYYNAYLYHWGSVFKFPLAGGAFHPAYKELGTDGRPAMTIPPGAAVYKTGYLNAEVGVTGALWSRHCFGPVPATALNWGDPSCTCMGARFDVDAFGRLYVPDVFRFTVDVFDPAGNLITRLGRYGNADDEGLSLAWPACVSYSGGELFISDMSNRRITEVNLTPTTTATARIPPADPAIKSR